MSPVPAQPEPAPKVAPPRPGDGLRPAPSPLLRAVETAPITFTLARIIATTEAARTRLEIDGPDERINARRARIAKRLAKRSWYVPPAMDARSRH